MSFTDLTGLVVGCGSIGTRHVENLTEIDIDRLFVSDTDQSRATDLAARCDAEAVADLEAGLDENPDFAVVCVPTRYHIPVAQRIADNGCHLFIEKPLSDSMEDIDHLISTTESQNLRTQIGCNLRFHPALRKVKTLIEDGTIGTVTAARIQFGSYLPTWHPDEDYREMYSAKKALGGGVILDHIHEIDYARWLLDDVATVSCFAGQLSHLEIETEDTATIQCRLTDETLVQLNLDYVQRKYNRNLEVVGDEGTIWWDWNTNEVEWYEAATDLRTTWCVDDSWKVNDTFIDELTHFLRGIQEGTEIDCDIYEGKRSLAVALAAKRSDRTGSHVDLI